MKFRYRNSSNEEVFHIPTYFFRFIYLALNQTKSTTEAPLSSQSQVLVVQDDPIRDNPYVITEGLIQNKAEQMWVKGPPNEEGFFTLRNPYSAKLLTGTRENELNELIVKPGVYFDGKKFHFSGALPRGTKVRLEWIQQVQAISKLF